eukprot:1161610-Pelagomonas_calceolata.AAC.6
MEHTTRPAGVSTRCTPLPPHHQAQARCARTPLVVHTAGVAGLLLLLPRGGRELGAGQGLGCPSPCMPAVCVRSCVRVCVCVCVSMLAYACSRKALR